MNFQHSLEQELLKDSARTAFGRAGPGDPVAALAELGAFGLTVGEAFGGSSLGLVEAAIILQQAGRSGVRLPLAETVLLAGSMVADRPETAKAVLAGQMSVAAVTSGSLFQTGGRLRGTLTVSDTAQTAWFAAPFDEHAMALLPASIAKDGVHRASIEPGETAFDVAIDLSMQEVWTISVAHHGASLGILRCAELLGAAERCFELAISYLKDRTQFGQPIGANQALKHLAADHYLALENVRVAVEYAAAAMDAARAAPDDAVQERDAGAALAVMLAYVPRAAREIAEASIQFHGGIGLTWEYTLNGYLRRIIRIGMALGSVTQHRKDLLERIFEPADNRPAPNAVPWARKTA